MVPAVLLLEVAGDAFALEHLARLVGRVFRGPREIAIPLGDQTPEEILSLCVSLQVGVRRSRVVSGTKQLLVT
ncbi:MAG TPA: hypothetical protein VGA78_14930 [Gemmatimonadales bacterium]|jgi:hypothetical protein